jgi:hypothetical protein
LWLFKSQQLLLGTGTAIWWVTESQCRLYPSPFSTLFWPNNPTSPSSTN